MILILDPFVRVHLVHRAHLEANAKFNELLMWSLFDFFILQRTKQNIITVN